MTDDRNELPRRRSRAIERVLRHMASLARHETHSNEGDADDCMMAARIRHAGVTDAILSTQESYIDGSIGIAEMFDRLGALNDAVSNHKGEVVNVSGVVYGLDGDSRDIIQAPSSVSLEYDGVGMFMIADASGRFNPEIMHRLKFIDAYGDKIAAYADPNSLITSGGGDIIFTSAGHTTGMDSV